LDIPGNRRWFYRQIEDRLRSYDPGAQARIEDELRTWLDDVSSGRDDYTSVKRNALGDWDGFERMAIYDATHSFNFSRWWCGLLLMKLAIAHSAPFMCYKPEDPGSEISTAYFLDPRRGQNNPLVESRGSFS
jgi:hypothetical protein